MSYDVMYTAWNQCTLTNNAFKNKFRFLPMIMSHHYVLVLTIFFNKTLKPLGIFVGTSSKNSYVLIKQ